MSDLIAALSEVIANKHRELEAQVHHLINITIPDGWSVAHVISNADDNKWRYWETDPVGSKNPSDSILFAGPAWTDDVNKACHFARREDAETWAHDDEDACFIRRRIIAAGGAPLEDLQSMQQASDIDMANRARAATELCRRADRVLMAPPQIWCVGDLLPLIVELAGFVSFFAPNAKPAGQLAPEVEQTAVDIPPPPQMLPVSHLTTNDILRLFRAFVMRNATQWIIGAGDHHHPIWEVLAVEIEGVEPTSGPEWHFIQPLNRKSHGLLLWEDIEQKAAQAELEKKYGKGER